VLRLGISSVNGILVKKKRDKILLKMIGLKIEIYSSCGVLGMNVNKATEVDMEIDKNYDAFKKELPSLLKSRRGQFVLMHSQQTVDFFNNASRAFTEGFLRFGEGAFSVQEVTDEPDNLGFYSYAGGAGQA
jgi:hypothetical protein